MALLDPDVASQERSSQIMPRPPKLELGEVSSHVLGKLVDHGPDADEEVPGRRARQYRIPHLEKQPMRADPVLAVPHVIDNFLKPLRIAGELPQVAGSHPVTH